METLNTPSPETPCCSAPNCCSDKNKCILCGVVAVVALLLVATLAFFVGQQLGLKQVPLCSPCLACQQAINQLSPTASSSADPTAGWKTYVDPKNIISFKYPESYLIASRPESQTVSFYTDKKSMDYGGGYISFNITNTGTDVNIKSIEDRTNEKVVKKENVNINGYSGIKLETKVLMGEDSIRNYLFLDNKNGGGLIVRYILDENVFDQILSTFRFD